MGTLEEVSLKASVSIAKNIKLNHVVVRTHSAAPLCHTE